ncbi:chemotaxis-specific protein-glutamate methyltransferase CheB [Glaciecola siphonariae]|uniref:Protein-glutamate methylesterase/protein-glutamine glutaminase n=1 Tax=Glaciecola siphonariae TaxID=521012 RepID=A0ABV9LTH8_9ALTE
MLNKPKIKALVVDDSSLMRSHICAALVEHGIITDTAANGVECLEKIARFQPDVITLDINMPVMDGLECLAQIMKTHPLPVVMVSSLTQKNASETLKALDLGAVDYVAKPHGSVSLTLNRTKYMLVSKVVNASKIDVRRLKKLSTKSKQPSAVAAAKIQTTSTIKQNLASSQVSSMAKSTLQGGASSAKASIELIVVGVSTGGPGSLQEIIPKLPANYPYPIVIAQHMPSRFTKVFAARLNKLSQLKVEELSTDTRLQPGHAYVAQGDANVQVYRKSGYLYGRPNADESHHIWKPSITLLVESAIKSIQPTGVCYVQLTGMGNDGAESMAKAHTAGATTIAESEETCVVYGMPKALVKLNGASKILANYDIAQALMSL